MLDCVPDGENKLSWQNRWAVLCSHNWITGLNERWKGWHVDTQASSNLGTPRSLQWLLKSYVPCRQAMLNCRGRGFHLRKTGCSHGTWNSSDRKMLEMFSFPIAFSLRLLSMRARSMPSLFLSFLAAWSSSWNIWPPYCISYFPHPLLLK